MMPISDPHDRFSYPLHTPMKDTYCITINAYQQGCNVNGASLSMHMGVDSSSGQRQPDLTLSCKLTVLFF